LSNDFRGNKEMKSHGGANFSPRSRLKRTKSDKFAFTALFTWVRTS